MEDAHYILFLDAQELFVRVIHRIADVKRQFKLELALPSREAFDAPFKLVTPRRALYHLRQSPFLRICVARVRALPDIFFRLVNEVLHAIGDGGILFSSAFVLANILQAGRYES